MIETITQRAAEALATGRPFSIEVIEGDALVRYHDDPNTQAPPGWRPDRGYEETRERLLDRTRKYAEITDLTTLEIARRVGQSVGEVEEMIRDTVRPPAT